MISKLKSFLFDRKGAAEGASHTKDELHIAAAALLLEVGMLDGELGDRERTETARLVQERFSLSSEETDLIMADAEARAANSVDFYGFLKVLVANFEYEEQIEMIEMLWDVVYADGVEHDHEAALVRRVVGIMGIEDRISGAARKRAKERAVL